MEMDCFKTRCGNQNLKFASQHIKTLAEYLSRENILYLYAKKFNNIAIYLQMFTVSVCLNKI